MTITIFGTNGTDVFGDVGVTELIEVTLEVDIIGVCAFLRFAAAVDGLHGVFIGMECVTKGTEICLDENAVPRPTPMSLSYMLHAKMPTMKANKTRSILEVERRRFTWPKLS